MTQGPDGRYDTMIHNFIGLLCKFSVKKMRNGSSMSSSFLSRDLLETMFVATRLSHTTYISFRYTQCVICLTLSVAGPKRHYSLGISVLRLCSGIFGAFISSQYSCNVMNDVNMKANSIGRCYVKLI